MIQHDLASGRLLLLEEQHSRTCPRFCLTRLFQNWVVTMARTSIYWQKLVGRTVWQTWCFRSRMMVKDSFASTPEGQPITRGRWPILFYFICCFCAVGEDCMPLQLGLSKVMCDLFCIDDAVRSGTTAVLSSLQDDGFFFRGAVVRADASLLGLHILHGRVKRAGKHQNDPSDS